MPHIQFPLLFKSYNSMVHLLKLMNQVDESLLTEVHTLLKFLWFLPNTLSVPGSQPGHTITPNGLSYHLAPRTLITNITYHH